MKNFVGWIGWVIFSLVLIKKPKWKNWIGISMIRALKIHDSQILTNSFSQIEILQKYWFYWKFQSSLERYPSFLRECAVQSLTLNWWNYHLFPSLKKCALSSPPLNGIYPFNLQFFKSSLQNFSPSSSLILHTMLYLFIYILYFISFT